MANPFTGEMRWVSFSILPQGWAQCNGQLLSIPQNQQLFSLLGTTYGGNGKTNFALPNATGCVLIHEGNGYALGKSGGEASHTLTITELPTHAHMLNGTATTASLSDPAGNVLGGAQIYGSVSQLTPTNPGSIGQTGGSQAHPNMQPYLNIICIIALTGLFPSQN